MTLLTKNSVLRVGLQATRGAPPPPANIRTLRVLDVNFDPVHANRIIERMNSTGVFGADSSLHGGNLGAVSFSWQIHPGEATGAVSPDSYEGILYECASFVGADVVGGGGRTYTLTSNPNDMKFAQMEFFYGAGRKRTLQDAVCSALSFTMNAGEAMLATATFVGRFIEDVDAPIPAALALSFVKPYVCNNANVSLAGNTSFTVKSLTVNMGLAVPDRGDITHESSYAAPVIVNRLVKYNIVLEQEAVSVIDWQDRIKTKLATPMLYSQLAPNFQISIPYGVVESKSDGDDEGVKTDELEVQAARNNGNDELNMTIGTV